MQIVALLFAIAALVSFGLAARPVASRVNLLALGLFLAVAAAMAQVVIGGGWHWYIR